MSARMSHGAALLAAVLVPLVLAVSSTPARAQSPWKPSLKLTANTYVGGVDRDELQGVVRNDQNQIVVVGQTSSSDFPGGAGPTSSSSTRDVVVARFKPDGSLDWARAFGGDNDDTAIDVRLVPNTSGQEVYVVGTIKLTSDNVFRTTPTASGTSGPTLVNTKNAYVGGDSDAFLARLNERGEVRWVLFLGGGGLDEGVALEVASDGSKVYVGGRTQSDRESFSPNATGVRGAGFDGFVTQVDVSNPDSPTVVWNRLLGSSGHDALTSVALMGGSLYVGGTMTADISLTDSSLNPVLVSKFHGGTADGFVAKLEPTTGNVLKFNHVGSTLYEEIYEVLASPTKAELIVVGITDSPTFVEPRSSAGVDIFVSRMSADADLLAEGHRVGGPGNERMSDRSASLPGQSHATLDALGNVYIAGRTSSESGFALNAFDDAYSDNTGGTHSDGFVAMVDASLTYTVWASYVGGTASSDEWVLGVSAGPGGTLSFVGYSNADDVLRDLELPNSDISVSGPSDGVLMSLEVDSSGPILQGVVSAEVSAQGILSANWAGFSDPQTPVSGYQWAVTSEGVVVGGGFKSVGPTVTAIPDTEQFKLTAGKPYVVVVRAFNGVGVSTDVKSNEVTWKPAGGTGDTPGEPGTGTSDEALSPLGWGCGSTGSGAMAGALGLVAVTLLSARRPRRGAGR